MRFLTSPPEIFSVEICKNALSPLGKEYTDRLAKGLTEGWVDKYEKHHEERYRKLLKNVEDKVVFSKDGDAIWQCRNCGHIVVGKEAPAVCPVCAHPQAYFEVAKENY